MFLNLKHLEKGLIHTWVWWKHHCPLSNLIPPNCIQDVSPKTEWRRGENGWVSALQERLVRRHRFHPPSKEDRLEHLHLAPGSFKRRRALSWRQYFILGPCIFIVLVFNIKHFLHAIGNKVRILDFISSPSHAFFKVIICKHISEKY